jgi:hypothetical protein
VEERGLAVDQGDIGDVVECTGGRDSAVAAADHDDLLAVGVDGVGHVRLLDWLLRC